MGEVELTWKPFKIEKEILVKNILDQKTWQLQHMVIFGC